MVRTSLRSFRAVLAATAFLAGSAGAVALIAAVPAQSAAAPAGLETAAFDVYFEAGAHFANARSAPLLDAIADEIVTEAPDAVIVIGHADDADAQPRTIRLPEARAAGVAEALAARGVDRAIITTAAAPETMSPSSAIENRRVQIVFERQTPAML
ncbi:MAG: OmpA family protein [Pseudomonadota bacterium]